MEYYYDKEGRICVLISPGYGSGWSNGDFRIAADKRVIEYYLAHPQASQEEWEEFMAKELGMKYFYAGSYNLQLRPLEKGKFYYIHEYDGNEWLVELKEGINMLYGGNEDD